MVPAPMSIPFLDRVLLPLRLARARARGAFVRPEMLAPPLFVESYDLHFDEGEVAYNGLGRLADGRIVFAVSTKTLVAGAHLFDFDPRSSTFRNRGDLDRMLPQPSARVVPQGKVHVDFARIGDVSFAATHAGHYDPTSAMERPAVPAGWAPYPGGWFFALDADRVVPLARAPNGEGIIALSADAARRRLFALTWPHGHFLSLAIDSAHIGSAQCVDHGPVLGDGESGSREKGTWTRICRSLGVDDVGHVYWSDAYGRIVRWDGRKRDEIAATPDRGMWRKVIWHPEERVFYGIEWDSAGLFRFDPRSASVESLGTLRVAQTQAPATLALALSADGRRLHALATGPGLLRDDDLQLAATVNAVVFDLDRRDVRFSGPLRLEDGRWITQAQSLLVVEDQAYAICWIEVPRGDVSPRAHTLRTLRRSSPEYHRRGYVEEIRLVRFRLAGSGG